jgi:signal transduction histidine kinase
VRLRGTGDAVHLTVRDEGVGFDVEAASRGSGLGLTSMKERLKLVGGELVIESRSTRGTTVLARAPVRRT